MGLDTPVFQAYRGTEPPRFASQAELECAKVLDYYGVPWLYEPTTFVLERDADGRVTEAFAPDFYLPDQDLYVELTVMKQSLVTRKNRKLRKLRERYPEVKIKLFYGGTSNARPALPPRHGLVGAPPRTRASGRSTLGRRARARVCASSEPRSPRLRRPRADPRRLPEGEPRLPRRPLARAADAPRPRLRRARRLRQRPDGRPRADPRAQGPRRRHPRPRRDRRRGRDRHRAHLNYLVRTFELRNRARSRP